MQGEWHLCWHKLGVGVADVNVINYGINYGINKSTLSEFIHTIAKFLDVVDFYKVHWMALILNGESLVLHLLYDLNYRVIIVPKEHAIINVYNEHDVIAVEHALVYEGLQEPDFSKLFDYVQIPHAPSLFLAI